MKHLGWLILPAVGLCFAAFPPASPTMPFSELWTISQRIEGEGGQAIGNAVRSGADCNGDGVPDVATRWRGYYVYVVCAATNPVMRIGELDGTNGFAMESDLASYDAIDLLSCGTGQYSSALVYGGSMVSNQGTDVQQACALRTTEIMPSVTNADYIDGANGWRLLGTTNARFIAYCAVGCKDFLDKDVPAVVNRANHKSGRRLYVTYCSTSIPALFTVDEFDGTNGMAIVGGTHLSEHVVSGDVNGDGLGDIICTDSPSGDGTKAYIIFGKRRYCRELNLNTLSTNDGVVLEWTGIVGTPVACGDVNGDGIDDIIYNGVLITGRHDWPALFDASANWIASACGLGVIGDINGDGYADTAANTFTGDWPFYIYFCEVGYGRPVPPYVTYDNYLFYNGTNGFVIKDDGAIHTACRGGDWDKDGYEEAVFGWPLASPGGRTSAGEIYITHGGPSPAWSPYIFAPTLVLEGQSNWHQSEWLTNVVIGRKGKRHMVLSDSSQPIEQNWLGTWWTNAVVRGATNDTVTVRYWTTNVISVSAPATMLTIAAVPEPALCRTILAILCGAGAVARRRR